MGQIKRMDLLTHEQLQGTVVYKMDMHSKIGHPQEVLVSCQPNTVIQLHRHNVDAEMFIVAGAALVLSEDKSMHGRLVTPGDVVIFRQGVAHGFKASDQGLSFVSRNGGIVDESGSWDIQFGQ